MARLAEAAGFKALYLSGGSLGWYKGGTEANITMTELAQVALDMRAVSKLPIVLDAGGGFGDPVHMHRTIAMTEAAGFAAIEIEDQALRRGEAFHQAGADMLFIYSRTPEEMRIIGERLPPPLMTFAPPDGFAEFPISPAEMAKLGFRLAASSGTAFAAMHKAVKQSYECLAQGKLDPFLGRGGAEKEMKAAQATCDFPRYLDIERRTMKDA